MDDRRKSTRIDLPGGIPAKVKNLHDARLVDVSSEGAQLELRTQLSPGTRCTVDVPAVGARFDVVIRRCRAAGLQKLNGEAVMVYRAGIELADPRPEEREALEDLAIEGVLSGEGGDPDADRILVQIKAEDGAEGDEP